MLHGTAFTVFVEPSSPTTSRPGPPSTCGSGPVEYGVAGPGGPYAPVSPLGAGWLACGVEAAGEGDVVEGSEIGGGPGSGGGRPIVSPVVPGDCCARVVDDKTASKTTEQEINRIESSPQRSIILRSPLRPIHRHFALESRVQRFTRSLRSGNLATSAVFKSWMS